MLLKSELLAARAEVVHGFGTGALGTDYARAAAELGLPGAPVALVDQVHGARVLCGDHATDQELYLGSADAVLLTRPGVIAGIRTADCVPILLAAPGAVCAVHAGWRGTVARIAQVAVRELCRVAGCGPGAVLAAIGPAISLEAYEVGDEVLAAVAEVAPAEKVIRGRRVDLKATNRHLLQELGVSAIDVLPHCTAADPSLFSYRADGPGTGRQTSFIALVSTCS
jgi:YfiH family protein